MRGRGRGRPLWRMKLGGSRDGGNLDVCKVAWTVGGDGLDVGSFLREGEEEGGMGGQGG